MDYIKNNQTAFPEEVYSVDELRIDDNDYLGRDINMVVSRDEVLSKDCISVLETGGEEYFSDLCNWAFFAQHRWK